MLKDAFSGSCGKLSVTKSEELSGLYQNYAKGGLRMVDVESIKNETERPYRIIVFEREEV